VRIRVTDRPFERAYFRLKNALAAAPSAQRVTLDRNLIFRGTESIPRRYNLFTGVTSMPSSELERTEQAIAAIREMAHSVTGSHLQRAERAIAAIRDHSANWHPFSEKPYSSGKGNSGGSLVSRERGSFMKTIP
jgi:hypothetical protein